MWIDKLEETYPNVEVIEDSNMPVGQKGLYINGTILLNKNQSYIEKRCTLAEELGHHETTYGDIVYSDVIVNRKLEIIARRWGYKKLIPKDTLQEAYNKNFIYYYEMAEYLDVTEEFLHECIKYYNLKNGS
ncbi:Phage protein [Brachybacterium faecium]|nr:Phage protein [Brachybacterium faecium]